MRREMTMAVLVGVALAGCGDEPVEELPAAEATIPPEEDLSDDWGMGAATADPPADDEAMAAAVREAEAAAAAARAAAAADPVAVAIERWRATPMSNHAAEEAAFRAIPVAAHLADPSPARCSDPPSARGGLPCTLAAERAERQRRERQGAGAASQAAYNALSPQQRAECDRLRAQVASSSRSATPGSPQAAELRALIARTQQACGETP